MPRRCCGSAPAACTAGRCCSWWAPATTAGTPCTPGRCCVGAVAEWTPRSSIPAVSTGEAWRRCDGPVAGSATRRPWGGSPRPPTWPWTGGGDWGAAGRYGLPRRGGGRVRGAGAGGRAPPAGGLGGGGVVGLGGSGPLRAPAAGVVASLTAAEVPLLAVDLPSGVDADTGTVHDPHVSATVTVTFGALRRAHLLASPACGRVEVEIGRASCRERG